MFWVVLCDWFKYHALSLLIYKAIRASIFFTSYIMQSYSYRKLRLCWCWFIQKVLCSSLDRCQSYAVKFRIECNGFYVVTRESSESASYPLLGVPPFIQKNSCMTLEIGLIAAVVFYSWNTLNTMLFLKKSNSRPWMDAHCLEHVSFHKLDEVYILSKINAFCF